MAARRRPRTALVLSIVLLSMGTGLAIHFPSELVDADGPDGREGGNQAEDPGAWQAETLVDGEPISAVTAGDLDPSRPGNECAIGGVSGRIRTFHREGDHWTLIGSQNLTGDISGLVAWDLLPDVPGEELLAGMGYPNGSGAVQLLSGLGSGAALMTPIEIPGEVVAIGTGNLVTAGPGKAFALADSTGNVTLISVSTLFRSCQPIFHAGGISSILVADLEPTWNGDEVLVGTSSGELWELYNDVGWCNRSIWTSDEGIESLACGDADPMHEGREVILGGIIGGLTLLENYKSVWSGRTVWRSGNMIPALTAGDLAPNLPGPAIITFGQGTDNLSLVSWDGSNWNTSSIWRVIGGVNELEIVEIDDTHPGLEILLGGASGAASLGYYHPALRLTADEYSMRTSGEPVVFNLTIIPVEKLQGLVQIQTTNGLPVGIGAELSAERVQLVSPSVSVFCNITFPTDFPDREFSFNVTAIHEDGPTDSIQLNVTFNRTYAFNITLYTRNYRVVAGENATYDIAILNTGTVADSYTLSAGTDLGWSVQFPDGKDTGTIPPAEIKTLTIAVLVPSDAEGKTAKLTVLVSSVAQPQNVRTASIRIPVPAASSCCPVFLLPFLLFGAVFLARGNSLITKERL